MIKRCTISIVSLCILAACESSDQIGPRTLAVMQAPAEANQTVALSGVTPIGPGRTMQCTPTGDVSARAAAAMAQIDAQQGSIAGTNSTLSLQQMGAGLETLYTRIGQETGCYFVGMTSNQSVEATLPIAPGDLELHSLRPPGSTGVPKEIYATCAVPAGQTAAQGRAHALNAARAYMAAYDRIQTAFERRVEREGSAAYQNSDNLERQFVENDRIKAEFGCAILGFGYPIAT